MDLGLEGGDCLFAVEVDLEEDVGKGSRGDGGNTYVEDLLLGGLYGDLHGGRRLSTGPD